MKDLIRIIQTSWTTRNLRFALARAGLDCPGRILGMLISEPAEYTAAAILAVSTRGE